MLGNEDPSMTKNTGFIPWNPALKANVNIPEPSRIVSDIVGSAAVKASAAGILSSNPRIQAAQSEWERRQSQYLSKASESSQVIPQKRNSPSDLLPKRTPADYARVREARRFTEDEVARQLAEINSAAIKKSAMHHSSQSPVVSLTGAELLKKYTGQGTPSPTPGPARSPDSLVPDTRLEAIIMAEPGRAYTVYPFPEGGSTSARGALIPANYKLHDDPELPYVCPVRDCRRVFGKLNGLGGHFGAGHCSTTFNDNGDGTLSKVGSYQKDGPGGTPGIVVSRNPLPPDAPPPVDPGLSVFASFQQNRVSRAAEQERKTTRSQDRTCLPQAMQESEVKQYLHQHLSPAQKSHQREDINFMLTLPRRRELPESWKHTHRGSNLDVTHYSCAVAYLTGTVVVGSEQCTVNTTRPSARLSQPCIRLPIGMSASAKQSFSALESCVGCRYWCHLQRRSNGCDWCPEPKLGRGASGSSRSSSGELNPPMDLDDFEGVDTMTEVQPKRRKRRSSGNDVAMRDQTLTIMGRPEIGVELEMEDWEVAPGRIKDESSSDRKISEESTGTEEVVSKARFVIDPEGELTHDQTTVDVVTVPCPGADPLRTWSRDGLMSRYYGALSMRDAEGAASDADRPAPSWVRQGLRREADRARILLYAHPSTTDDTRLSTLADALLEELGNLRKREQQKRPVVFVGHSIGGIIVKMVLTKASRDPSFEDIYRQCYGAAFFGSSYFAMPSLATGIQNLLQLSAAMPTSITDDLRVGNNLLLQLDDDFKSIAHEFRIWTLYETIDSRLSGSSGDVYFTAPLTSIKSAILGMRQETILPLQSDHANIASFGRHNVHTMRLFLKQLSALIGRADEYSREDGNWSLNLESKVNVEVHGFFEDPPGPLDVATIRAWSTRLPLRDFLRKGPEECLAERLNEVETVDEGRFLRNRGKTTMLPTEKVADETHDNPLGISQGSVELCPPASPVIRPVDAEKTRSESAPQAGARSPVTPLSPAAISPPTHYSTPMRRPSPLIRANFEQDLAVDRLSPPPRGRMGRSLSRSVSMGTQASQYEYKDFPPFSQRSRSTIEGFSDDDDIDASPRLPEAIVAIRKAANNGERRASETVIVDEVPVAFSKPHIETRKFMWVHLPYNNPSWVTKIFETLQTANNRNYAPLFNNDFWATRHSRGRHSQHYAYFAKPGCYFSAPRHSRSSKQSSISPKPEGGIYTCLFLPYLHFDSYKRLIRRRELILQRLGHGRARPVPESVAKSDSLESQVIWEFLGHDPPLNCRRTLDQYGYPSLRDTRSRDDDQMLYKLTKERTFAPSLGPGLHGQMSNSSSGSSGSGSRRSKTSSQDGEDEEGCEDSILNGNVLMVDQVWLWAIDSHTLLSFFPKREGDAIEGPLYQQADLRDSIFNEVNVDLTRQCENALDLAALAVLHAVTVLLDRSSHPDLEVFRIFEEAISVLTEKLTSSLKTFRAEGFRDKASAYEPVENKARSIRARHKAEGRRAEEDNRDNTSALLELRDIEDELLILVHLFERQSKVVSSMLSTYTRPELRDRTANGRLFLSEAIKKVSEYTHQAQEMIQRVRSTRNDYDKLLQMVQRQAQVDEVRLSRLHADLASAQSRSVMIFTTFTVIFLPLTFFTGLFGMNTQEWGGENNLSLKTIGAISLPASFALVVFSLVAAFSTNARLLIKWLAHMYRHMMSWVWRTLCKPAVAKVADMLPQRNERQREERDSRSGKGMLREEMSDFWERHRLERDRGYTVPEKNKRTVVSGKSSWRKMK
ncbi:hypothetical protein FOVSG1_002254 [Fusarium oxysporum f. sp. vasinfectum]